MKFSEVPEGYVPNLRRTLDDFAQKNDLVINEDFAWKIEWMASHQGRCACDPANRRCPCAHVFEDLKRFNGRCLCRVFFTPERVEQLKNAKKNPELTPLEKKQRKELREQKRKRDKDRFQKLSSKCRKKGRRLRKIVDV